MRNAESVVNFLGYNVCVVWFGPAIKGKTGNSEAYSLNAKAYCLSPLGLQWTRQTESPGPHAAFVLAFCPCKSSAKNL